MPADPAPSPGAPPHAADAPAGAAYLPGWLPAGIALVMTIALALASAAWWETVSFPEVFLLPVIVAGFLGGLRAGLVATLLGATAGAVLILSAAAGAEVPVRDMVEWLLLVITGVLVAALTGALHASRGREQRLRRDLEELLETRTADARTEQTRQLAIQAEREARLAGIIHAAMDGIITVDVDQRIVLANPAAEAIFQRRESDLIGQPLDILLPERHRALHARRVREFAATGHTSRRMDRLQPLVGLRADGSEFPMEATISQVVVGGTRLATVILRDVTERSRVEEALRDSDERFRQLAESIREVFWLATPDLGTIEYVSPAWESIWGCPREAVYASASAWLESIHQFDRDRLAAAIPRLVTGEYDEEYRIVRADGVVRWIRDRAFPVRGANGAVIRIAGVAEDVTERRELEAQLRQAQKMESIGQLAGGVAHDFNNWLTVIAANSELARASLPAGHPAVELMDEVRLAGERAAALTRQLLTFSRLQAAEPAVMDLNAAVADTERLLRRLIGEDVVLETELRATGRVVADPGHVSQILMNLAVNARDALPMGGRVRIETADVVVEDEATVPRLGKAAGRYVRLRVADTGSGMSPEVRARIFEPFFTTKGFGRGTGLGLAVVHGIVQQCGGHIDVSSEVGKGTAFTILFPAAPRPETPRSRAEESPGRGGVETILLVEDDDIVREVAARALRAAGYDVLDAGGPAEALRRVESRERPIHLLLTDVVMPGMGGRELADEVRRRIPGARVLFTSGYLDDAVVRYGVQHAEVAFLQKPWDAQALLGKVRQVLDRPAAIPAR